MVIIMNPEATSENISEVIKAIEGAGLEAKIMEGAQQKIVGVIGDKTKMASVAIGALPGVEHSVEISKSYKLASREFHPQSSVIDVDGIKIGGGEPVVMAGRQGRRRTIFARRCLQAENFALFVSRSGSRGTKNFGTGERKNRTKNHH